MAKKKTKTTRVSKKAVREYQKKTIAKKKAKKDLPAPAENICPGCNKVVVKGDPKLSHLVVARWHKMQLFHAKEKCIKGFLEEFTKKVMIKELDKSYKDSVDGKIHRGI